ncbi:type II toxin-antitoxin system RelE/ParE family toxin [Desulfosarcina sp. OttesenSCG-928-B08]|nr:type II toxin-antitoxin system RelE/ParE family toxin [Desulfosarcina sp. OttesenSCG-928-B08]
MNTIYQTSVFSNWLKNLKDIQARAKIIVRIRLAENGHFGDCAPVGEGVSEMRLHFGPGYRLYFWHEGKQVYWLLAGGDKGSQKRDIDRAKHLRREIEEMNDDKDQQV